MFTNSIHLRTGHKPLRKYKKYVWFTWNIHYTIHLMNRMPTLNINKSNDELRKWPNVSFKRSSWKFWFSKGFRSIFRIELIKNRSMLPLAWKASKWRWIRNYRFNTENLSMCKGRKCQAYNSISIFSLVYCHFLTSVKSDIFIPRILILTIKKTFSYILKRSVPSWEHC